MLIADKKQRYCLRVCVANSDKIQACMRILMYLTKARSR